MTCAKATVRCAIIGPDGQRFVGENECLKPQAVCPRAPGEGYGKCKSICEQIGHAENVAALRAGRQAAGGVAYVEGHTYACVPCRAALASVGVFDLQFTSPPEEGTPTDETE